MTVAELIEALEKYPSDTLVLTSDRQYVETLYPVTVRTLQFGERFVAPTRGSNSGSTYRDVTNKERDRDTLAIVF